MAKKKTGPSKKYAEQPMKKKMQAKTEQKTTVTTTAPSIPPLYKRFLPYGLLTFAVLLFIDQYTKRAIYNSYPLGASHQLLPGLWFTHVQNTGAVWSSFPDSNGALIWLSIAAFGVLLFFYDTFTTVFEKIAYTLLLVGLWGNLLDRVALGYVVDFIDLGWWPIFNIADSCITIGVTLYLLEQLRRYRNERIEKSTEKHIN